MTLVKNLDSLSDLWDTGYGIMSLLELATLEGMAILLWRSTLYAGRDALRKEGLANPVRL